MLYFLTMNDLSEFNERGSEHELFSFFYDKVLSREISTFSQLKTYAAPVLKDKRTPQVLMRLFELIKKLNWGFFSTLNQYAHKKLWQELVISDKQFPEAGDLKRTLSISDLYIGMLDIHGYTKFCQETRKNLSMLHLLDRCINNEIRDLCTQCHAISKRERGDEIVMVAATATDAITAVLAIFDYFEKTNILNSPSINTRRSDEAQTLPSFKLSAGITGGNTSSPLIITDTGDLSGFLLNSGARLQVRANELSSKESRIMVAKQVYMNYAKENAQEKSVLELNNTIYFLDTGLIEFKGVQIPTMEIVFKPEDRYKEKVSESLNKLFDSIKDNLWEQRIYQDALELLSITVKHMPEFSVSFSEPLYNLTEVNNASFIRLCSNAVTSYLSNEDYPEAVNYLHQFITIIENNISSFDKLILDYLKGVTEKYDMLLEFYRNAIDKELEDKASRIFTGDYYKTWLAAKNGVSVYEKLKTIGRKSKEISGKKALWYTLIQNKAEEIAFKLYSGKK